MTHPEELLAGYVDGTLSQSERTIVDEHLAGCAVCRAEVAWATTARTRLGALAEQPAPAEISAAVQAALAKTSPARTSGDRTPARYRIVTMAAAAAVLALLVVKLPHVGGSHPTSQAAGGFSASSPKAVPVQAAFGAPSLEMQSIDYTAATAAKLARPNPAQSPLPMNPGFSGAESVTDTAARTALSCLQTAFTGIPGDPVRLIQASFQGQPAYIGVYTDGPGAGLPPDTVSVRVASVKGCTVLTFASSKI
jgi:anti-sigma factor RsiW